MHQIAVIVGSVTWAFVWNRKADAHNVLIRFQATDMDGPIEWTDDYGQTFHAVAGDIKAILLEDLEQNAELRAMRSVMDAKAQMRAQELAQADPKIAVRRMAGPSSGLVVPR